MFFLRGGITADFIIKIRFVLFCFFFVLLFFVFLFCFVFFVFCFFFVFFVGAQAGLVVSYPALILLWGDMQAIPDQTATSLIRRTNLGNQSVAQTCVRDQGGHCRWTLTPRPNWCGAWWKRPPAVRPLVSDACSRLTRLPGRLHRISDLRGRPLAPTQVQGAVQVSMEWRDGPPIEKKNVFLDWCQWTALSHL